MSNSDYLCQLFYVDIKFSEFTNSSDFNPKNIKQKLEEFTEESKNLTVQAIEEKVKKINERNIFWLNRLKDKKFCKKSVKLDSLIIEKNHDNLDGISGSSGKKISDFFNENKDNEKVKKRVKFVLANFDIINEYLPIIVKKADNNFEIMSGNHRTMVFAEKRCDQISVLEIIEIDNQKEKIIEALKKSGIPFEVQIREKLKDLGINTFSSRYFEKNQYGEVSKDIDLLGNVKFKTFENKEKNLFPCLQLRVISEVKDWSNSSICIFELDGEEPENLPFMFPNFLSISSHLLGYGGGYILLSEFIKQFGSVVVSKSVVYLQDNNGKLEQKGNEPLFKSSNNLLNACEYQHKKSISWITDEKSFKFNGLFPVIITRANIYKANIDNELSLDEIKSFFYLVACEDLDKLPITAKERYYLPILVLNEESLKDTVDLIKKISDALYNNIEKYITERPEIFTQEYQEYLKLTKGLNHEKTNN
ncbi:hypothetical protein HYW21_05545 [Candidatus Woesearchaeota archaeon]|nr:hypothetical protein [Candidatus Woesearchaeota archaeon]